MVISVLLEQVQQHENEYVVTLINPSTRNFRTALIISHQPCKTDSRDSKRRLYTGTGCLFPGAAGHAVTAPRAPEGPHAATRVEDLQGVLEQVVRGLKQSSQFSILYFPIINVMLKHGLWF